MKKLALALAATAALAFTAPAFAASDAPMKVAQVDVTIKKTVRHDGDGMRKKVVIRHGERRHGMERREVRMHRDHGRHEGWRRGHHDGMKKTVIIKRGNGKTVIKKKFEG